MTLAENLVSVKQREISGSRTSSRYQYQFSWGLMHLMSLHQKQDDYVVGFEYHDDVIDLDKTANPTKIRFYQVKTRSDTQPNWTLKAITKVDKEKALSISGKMYQNCTNILEVEDKSCFFVTNKHMNFCVEDKETFQGDELKSDEQKILSAAICKELKIDSCELNKINYHKTSLSLSDTEKHLNGRVVDFFLKQELTPAKVKSWTTHMLAEIRKLNNYCPSKISSYDDFLEYKALSKKNIEDVLNEIKKAESEIAPLFDSVISTLLIANKFTTSEIGKMRKYWNTIFTDSTNPSNISFNQLKKQIHQLLDKKPLEESNLQESLHDLYKMTIVSLDVDEVLYPEIYIQALILWCNCEK